jgi:ATP-dependent Clp protease ATP-binding subunit ClpC
LRAGRSKLLAVAEYPFEKFSQHSRRALVCAQQEAEDAAAGYIGTEHLLLGLLRVGAGSAFRALQALDIDEMRLRRDIDQVKRAPAQLHLIPTKALKRAIEYAFEESARRGADSVRTAHILAGIVQVDDGVGAAVLKRQWAEPGTVMAAVDRELRLT